MNNVLHVLMKSWSMSDISFNFSFMILTIAVNEKHFHAYVVFQKKPLSMVKSICLQRVIQKAWQVVHMAQLWLHKLYSTYEWNNVQFFEEDAENTHCQVEFFHYVGLLKLAP